MITWMQRHKKWLIITIWISTIAFVGAGVVGWGQFKYGDKAGAVAKVGDIEITMGEFQKSYSNLYQQYAQMFQGNFDEEKAKQFGLQKQALNQLVQQAYMLNLAQEFDIQVSAEDIYAQLKQNKAFYKNGLFDKETYKQVLSQNRLSVVEYEAALKKEIMIQKLLAMLPVEPNVTEEKVVASLLNIADKIEYKVLDPQSIVIEVNDDELKTYWENIKQNYQTEVSYTITYIKHPAVHETNQTKITQYYQENKTHFKAPDGKLLSMDEAKEQLAQEVDKQATHKAALRQFVDFKNGKIEDNTSVQNATISASNNPFNAEVLQKVSQVSPTKPYIKPIEVAGVYYSFKLIQTNPPQTKSFEEAKELVKPLYLAQKKKEKIFEIANNTVKVFKGKTTEFLTVQSVDKLPELSPAEAAEFLQNLFTKEKKRDIIPLRNGKIVLYNILEQKLLENSNNRQVANFAARVKTKVFSQALMKTLQKRYKTQIFIEGL